MGSPISDSYAMNKEQGTKHDEGKLRYDLIPPYPLMRLAEVYTIGARKYGDRDWEKGISCSRLLGSMLRHIEAYRAGELVDKDDGQLHMASVAFCAFAVLYFDGKAHFDFEDDRVVK